MTDKANSLAPFPPEDSVFGLASALKVPWKMLVLSLYCLHVLKPSLLKLRFLKRSNPIMPKRGPTCVILGYTCVLSFGHLLPWVWVALRNVGRPRLVCVLMS